MAGPYLVGVDACVIIQGFKKRANYNPALGPFTATRLLNAASHGYLRLLIPDKVRDEAYRALRKVGMDEQFESFLIGLQPTYCPTDAAGLGLSPDEFDAACRWVSGVLHHAADAPIAVGLVYAASQPTCFVSNNWRHWTPAVGERIGIPVMTSDAFWQWLMSAEF